MKQLTQEIFKGQPSWVKSASVYPPDCAICHSVPTISLRVWLDVPFPMMRGNGKTQDAGDGYDTTNWQNSAIDREGIK